MDISKPFAEGVGGSTAASLDIALTIAAAALSVFPCGKSKNPVIAKRDGRHGFLESSGPCSEESTGSRIRPCKGDVVLASLREWIAGLIVTADGAVDMATRLVASLADREKSHADVAAEEIELERKARRIVRAGLFPF
jgi:hypothetical protein